MRFQDALQLQKQQLEHQERQKEAQARLEAVASRINAQFDYWCQFKDPFVESLERIRQLQRNMVTSGDNLLNAHYNGTKDDDLKREDTPSVRSSDVVIRHLDGSAEVDPTAFSLYRKLKKYRQ